MRSKQFDAFSFKAPSSKRSEPEEPGQQAMFEQQKQIKPSDIKFRHTHTSRMDLFDRKINDRISNISNELEENIKRRIELQKKLESVVKADQKKQERQIFMAYSGNTYKKPEQIEKQFKRIESKADRITELIAGKPQPKSAETRLRQLQRSRQILLDHSEAVPTTNKEKILMPIMQSLAAKQTRPLPVYTVPDQIKIQKLLRKVTFPEVPQGNLQSLRKQIEHLYAIHQPHSDIHYLLMMVYFHEQKYLKVRKHFEEIIMFKNFNQRAYWIAAQTQFALQNYDLCLSLSEDAMNKLEDKYLPRFIYLKAKCYDQIRNYINSIVCFNQLIKIKPKISEYYLQRGVLYHRIGYYKEAKEDFTRFGVCNPNAQEIVKEKILAEKNEVRRKEYISLLAQMY